MAVFTASVRGDGLSRFTRAIDGISDKRLVGKAQARALNHTGQKANTQVKRTVAKQMGLPQKKLKDKLSYDTASPSSLQFVIKGKGQPFSMKEFKAKQGPKGTSASPWNNRKLFKSTFIFAGNRGSSQLVAGGHVFRRTTSASLPVEKLWGPALPKEMVKAETKAAFESTSGDLNDRIAHEYRRLTGGAVS